MKNKKIIITALAILLIGGGIYLSQPHEHGKGEEHSHAEGGHEEEADTAEILPEAIKSAGIEIAEVGSATINETVKLSGRITLNQNKTAAVKARFPGIVRSVRKAQGDNVAVGEVLATVESNESLQVYTVTSPIAGVVLARNSNVGDVAESEPMFTVADISELWVELHVFSQDAANVKAGQEVIISSTEGQQLQRANIVAMLPMTEASTQTLVARATVKNLDSHWLPGMAVRGDVVVSSKDAEIAVKASAIQRMENKQVVFVQHGNNYTARQVKTEASDTQWTEIIEGVKAGEKYVSDGSFIIKAEIGKSEAEHAH